IPGFDDEQKRVIAATVAGLRIVGVYVPNGQAVDSDKYRYKLTWYAALADMLRAELARHPALAVGGDFNVAPEDRDVHDPVAWAGQIHCSEPEREAFKALLAVGLKDSFRLFDQPEKTFSWWDYRMLAFPKNHGLRIDHVLLVASLVFYAWGEAPYLALVVGSVLFNYTIGGAIGRSDDARRRRRWLIVGVVGNLGALAVFKYANFAVANVNVLAPILAVTP